MIRLAIIFIIWERHHYDRSTLSMLSDLYHQKINFPAYYNFKEQWLSIITEKKVEIWHSLLRNHISTHYSGDEIHDTAISLAASDTARKFHSSFVRPYTRGQSEKNMKLVAETSNLSSEEPDTELTPNNSRQPIFYESDEWEQFVDHALANVTVPQPPSLRVQGQQQECQQQHPKQPHCQDQGVNHQAQQANQNISITSVNSAGSKFLFFP
ncbi:unnamed protein product, partial [Porites lobata]